MNINLPSGSVWVFVNTEAANRAKKPVSAQCHMKSDADERHPGMAQLLLMADLTDDDRQEYARTHLELRSDAALVAK